MHLTHRTGRLRTLGASVVGLALVASVLSAPSAAARTPAPSRQPRAPGRLSAHGAGVRAGWSSVTVQLTPTRPTVVTALARARGLTVPTRRAALLAAAPSQSTSATVTRYLTHAGLTVTAHTMFSVTATGPVARVSALFPTQARTHTSAHSLGHVTAGSVTASPLRVPRELHGLATFVTGGTDTGPVARPLQVRPRGTVAQPAFTPGLITGPIARSLYAVPAGATTQDGAGITVATLQFSGWDDSNLTYFAAHVGLPDPVASGQYQAISVDGADPTAPDGNGGEGEVALDQETLLTVAPHAAQVAYVAPNSTTGEVDALNAVANDALTNNAGLNYTALSISWGGCEPFYTTADMSAIDAAIQNVVAAGVTVFASSGDAGAYDCSTSSAPDDSLAVDYPASDPNVIGVGGLTTDPTARAETSWWHPTGNLAPGYLGDGGGGGESTYWALPSWQNGVSRTAVNRLVPDISLDADPSSGELVRTDGSWQVIGGTSLASPLAAATLTDLQIADGASYYYALGNISPNLYGAPASSFRDTTTGSNGYYQAGSGYDLATGLGAPLWSRLNSAILGSPNLTAPASTNTLTIPISVTTPTGMIYTGFRGGVGTATEPTTCDPTGATTSPPTSETATQYGPTVVWVIGYTASGNCFVSEAPVVVVHVGASSAFTAAGPCRLFDTRTGSGNCLGSGIVPTSPLGAGRVMSVQVTGAAGVPSNATAVVMNLTAVGATSPTYVTAWPDGQARPTVSNLNVSNSSAVPNLAVIPLGSNGKIDLFNSLGSVDLIGDVSGYFAPSAGSTLTTTGPCRVFDTRSGAGNCPGSGSVAATPLGAGGTMQLNVVGVAGVPSNATAVVMNLTAVGATRNTYVTAWPDGQQRPTVSNLNVANASATPNLAIIPIGVDGMIDLYNAAGGLNLIGDISGFFAPTTSASLATTGPCRVFDTRSGAGNCPGSSPVLHAALAAGHVLRVQVGAVAGVPDTATAVVMNLTAVGATAGTFITAWPDGQPLPTVSNLNVSNSNAVPNLAVIPIGSNGMIDLYSASGKVNLIGDISGYFSP